MTLEASHLASREQFEEVLACMRNVREAWAVVARDPEAQGLLPRDLKSQKERYETAPRLTPVPSETPVIRWSA